MKSINKQGGFSLVEILLVLGVIAILAIAAFIIFPQVQAGSRANTEQSNITTITAGVKNLYGAKRDYTGINAETVNKARIAPSSMNGGDFATATTLTSSWNGDVAVAVGADPKTFTVAYADMPSEVCTRLVPGLLQNFTGVGFGADAAAAVTDAEGTTALNGQSNPGAVVTSCQGTNGVVSVAFLAN